MSYWSNEMDRAMRDETRRLLHEVSSQRMSWKNYRKIFLLNALLREHYLSGKTV